MLVLTRKRNESAVLDLGDGRTVCVTVLEIRGTRVRLGIEAPRDINVVRDELLDREDKPHAAGDSPAG